MVVERWTWVGLLAVACGSAPSLDAGGAPPGEPAQPTPAEMPPGTALAPPASTPASTAEEPATPAASPVPAAGAPEAPVVGGLDTPPVATPELPSDAPTLLVSFTFDDTYAPQLEAADILEAHGFRGTFYVNSPRLYDGSAKLGASEYMSVADALSLQARGHEIGGHTLSHPSLTELPEAERQREIGGDRAQLLALGLEARSFAYPRGDVEADDASLGLSVLDIARASGYASARDTNGYPLGSCEPGPESVPPRDPFLLRSVRSVNDAPPAASGQAAPPPDTAATLLGWMDQAASCGGGWLPLIFHHLRVDCAAADGPGSYCFNFAELEQLAVALETGVRCPEGAPCYRVQVAPVGSALGPSALAPARDVLALRNASLERTLASGSTECFQTTVGEGGTAVFDRSELARTGVASQRMSIAEPFVAAAEVRVTRDYGACALFTQPGRQYQLSLHYRAEPGGPAPELRFVTYRLTSDYTWEAWASSQPFVAQSPGEWVEQTLQTDAVPVGTLAFSFGLRLQAAGAVAVDDFDVVALAATAPADTP